MPPRPPSTRSHPSRKRNPARAIRSSGPARVFLAGATGAVGRPLVRKLVKAGYEVVGTTRSKDKMAGLKRLGAIPIIMDGLDREAVIKAVTEARPDAVIHQMTALSSSPDFKHMDRWFATTNALRTEGTDNLLAAAERAGAGLFIAQSYTGWNNVREGRAVAADDEPLDPDPLPSQTATLAAFRHLHQRVLNAPMTGVILRYGNLYGPGASEAMVDVVKERKWPLVGDSEGMWSWLHVEDAAGAVLSALGAGIPGMFNIVDDEPARACEWLPYLAKVLRAKPPRRLPRWLARFFIGDVGVQLMTEVRAASNAKAKREIGFSLTYPSWRTGFRTRLV